MPLARIFRPSKSAMQSGTGKTHQWVLEFEPTEADRPDRLMGWIASADMQTQVQLHFETRDEAIAYAQSKAISFQLFEAQDRKVVIKAYSDNFASNRRVPWTH